MSFDRGTHAILLNGECVTQVWRSFVVTVNDFGIFDGVSFCRGRVLLPTNMRHVAPIVGAIWYPCWVGRGVEYKSVHPAAIDGNAQRIDQGLIGSKPRKVDRCSGTGRAQYWKNRNRGALNTEQHVGEECEKVSYRAVDVRSPVLRISHARYILGPIWLQRNHLQQTTVAACCMPRPCMCISTSLVNSHKPNMHVFPAEKDGGHHKIALRCIPG